MLRLAVSDETSARNKRSATSVAERHTPLTQTEPPVPTLEQVLGASMVSSPSAALTVPTSVILPLNM